ncbi:MAG: VOC family protein [Rhodothermales bacterium]|nr:VOC family protein [Rhodothermales bacterium]
MPDKPAAGTVTWFDLTVKDAERVRDFYKGVVGWKPEPVNMGAYNDFTMTVPSTGDPATGICHARGGNADLPAQWMIYVNVENLDLSMAACRGGGGKIIAGPKEMAGHGRYCVIQDPEGAVLALFEPAG